MIGPQFFDLLGDGRLRWSQSTCWSVFGHPGAAQANARVTALDGDSVEIRIDVIERSVWSNVDNIMTIVTRHADEFREAMTVNLRFVGSMGVPGVAPGAGGDPQPVAFPRAACGDFGDGPGQYVVFDGNRRLLLLRLLANAVQRFVSQRLHRIVQVKGIINVVGADVAVPGPFYLVRQREIYNYRRSQSLRSSRQVARAFWNVVSREDDGHGQQHVRDAPSSS